MSRFARAPLETDEATRCMCVLERIRRIRGCWGEDTCYIYIHICSMRVHSRLVCDCVCVCVWSGEIFEMVSTMTTATTTTTWT